MSEIRKLEVADDNRLFAGTVDFAGLSNERELVAQCPPEFRRCNPWSNYAMELFFNGGSLKNWKWRDADPAHQRHQRIRFVALLSGFGLPHESKEAIAGWMLSVMLLEVPSA